MRPPGPQWATSPRARLERNNEAAYFDRSVDAEDLDARIEFALTGLERVRARRRQETETSDVEPTPDEGEQLG